MHVITKYFPHLTENQQNQFAVMLRLYPEWNVKINVISRKDIDNLETNHILHSLSIGNFISFTQCTRVLDLGTGGGFPGIPLAVLFPEVHFHLVDRIGKKLRVAQDVVTHAEINNVSIQHGDIKEVKGKFDFIVSRAVMPLEQMVPLVRRLVTNECHNSMPNGLICLKGGDLDNELSQFNSRALIDDISHYFDEEYFKTKRIVYLPL